MITIAGQKHWLWRAVDQDGYVLDEIAQTRRDTKAAKCLLKRLLRKQGGEKAVLYEVVCEETKEVTRSRARRRSDAYQGTRHRRI